jgi:hypothetical protein
VGPFSQKQSDVVFGGSDRQRGGSTQNSGKQLCANTWLRGKLRVQLLLRLQTSKLEGSLKFRETK